MTTQIISSTRRTKSQMMIDILRVIQKHPSQIRLTHIMFKVAINCALLKKMIDSLIDKGYLEKTELFHKSWNSRMVPVKRKRTCSWKLTEKGRNFLAKFDEYESVISEIDKLCKL